MSYIPRDFWLKSWLLHLAVTQQDYGDIHCQVARKPQTAGKTVLVHLSYGTELSDNTNSLLLQPGVSISQIIFSQTEILNCELYFPVKRRRQTPFPAPPPLFPDCNALFPLNSICPTWSQEEQKFIHLHTPWQGTEWDILFYPHCTLHHCPHLENRVHPTSLLTKGQLGPCPLLVY